MLRRFGVVMVAVAGLLALGMVSAQAAGQQTNGNGPTAQSGSLGFNAQDDLSGNFEYHSPDGTLNIHCNDDTSYKQKTVVNPNAGTYPKSTVRSDICFDQNGNQLWLRAEFVDRGEGANAPADGECIKFAHDQDVAHDFFLADCGPNAEGEHPDPRLRSSRGQVRAGGVGLVSFRIDHSRTNNPAL